MFNFLKKKLSEDDKRLHVTYQSDISSITFKDLKLQDIILEIKPNGHETIFTITEKKSNTELVFDKERCLLLSAILQEYGSTGQLKELAQLFKGE